MTEVKMTVFVCIVCLREISIFINALRFSSLVAVRPHMINEDKYTNQVDDNALQLFQYLFTSEQMILRVCLL